MSPVPSLDIYDPNWPIWTYQQQFPPAKFVFDDDDRRGMAVDSMVSGGCIISGATVRRSLLFSNCRINSYARTREAVLLPDVLVDRYARLSKVVVEESESHTCAVWLIDESGEPQGFAAIPVKVLRLRAPALGHNRSGAWIVSFEGWVEVDSSRLLDGRDTDDNGADFAVTAAPTPGAPNAAG